MFQKTRGLGERILLGFMLQTLLIIVIYGVAMTESTEYMEKHLVNDMLHEEVLVLVDRLNRTGEEPELPPSMSLFGSDERLTPIPPLFQGLRDGFYEFTGDPSCFVFQISEGDRVYVLVRDQFDFEKSERAFNTITIVSVVIVFILASSFGWWWVMRRVLKPIRSLSNAVRSISESRRYKPLDVPVSDDEVGELAQICDRALHRLHEALNRERLFTANVSHELRTPLTVINTSAELLEMSDLNDREKRHVEKIVRASSDIHRLIGVFLDLARDGTLDAQGDDTLASVLEDAMEFWRDAALEKGLAFEYHREAPCPGTYSPVVLGTVVRNILKNAVRYTEKGGIKVVETAEGFRVIDTGPGINENDRQRVFKAFTRATDIEGGVGLGLYICRRICEQCGWSIEVEETMAETGSGTCFFVKLVGERSKTRRDARGAPIANDEAV